RGRVPVGVPHRQGGAADRRSHLRANALVGNRPEAAALELVAPGFACRFHADAVCALTGAPAAATLDGDPLPHDTVFTARAGQRLDLGPAPWGLRTVLAVRGGIAVEPVLGSRATDTLAGLGPAPLRARDRLPVGGLTGEQDWRAPAPAVAPAQPLEVPVVAAPGAAWVDTAALAESLATVTAASGRTALRLDAPALARRRTEEFPPQALVRGAVQVPPDGRPIVFLADHPVTGGYPVIGVVPAAHNDRLAQLRPGDRLRLVLR
ncbi:MAG TPA: biotin-dependent carboxyltransferase family protein, partial [Egibacteraceae bacterium]|nr:biotin-dependent carboxyltransferase family protein [Egibacteraceae bacterium]